MPPPYPFEPLLIFGIMAAFLLLGVLLRAKLAFLQRFLFPSCLVGGVLGLVVLSLDLIPVNAEDFEVFAYHLFIISFISVGLTHGNVEVDSSGKRELAEGAGWMALMQGVTLSLQAIVGCLLVILFGWFGLELYSVFGLFIPLGFTEGPGQALSIGKSWEAFGFENAGTIGLTFATAGFFFAFFVGVPLVNWGIRRGLNTGEPLRLRPDILKGIADPAKSREPAGHLTMHTGNVETLAFHMALIGLIYVLTYIVVIGINQILPESAVKTNWGFFFFYGLSMALAVRLIMKKIGILTMIDPGVQRRITGWAMDFLIVATVMGVQLEVVWKYILPISVMSIFGGIVTTIAVVWFGKRLQNYAFERTVFIYGTCTGTVSSGLLLLRIVDPEFRTPVALEAGLMNMLVVPIIVASMILVNAPVLWQWGPGLTALTHVGLLLISLVLLKLFKLSTRATLAAGVQVQ